MSETSSSESYDKTRLSVLHSAVRIMVLRELLHTLSLRSHVQTQVLSLYRDEMKRLEGSRREHAILSSSKATSSQPQIFNCVFSYKEVW